MENHFLLQYLRILSFSNYKLIYCQTKFLRAEILADEFNVPIERIILTIGALLTD